MAREVRRVPRGIAAGGRFAPLSHAEPEFVLAPQEPLFKAGQRVVLEDGRYATVSVDAYGTHRLPLVLGDGELAVVSWSGEVKTLEEHLEATMPSPGGAHLPAVADTVDSATAGALLSDLAPAASGDPEYEQGRAQILRHVRAALSDPEADGGRILAAAEGGDSIPGPQAMTGSRARQLAGFFVEQSREAQRDIDAARGRRDGGFEVLGLGPRALARLHTGRRDAALTAAIRLAAGSDLGRSRENALAKRGRKSLEASTERDPFFLDIVWDDSEWQEYEVRPE